MQAPRGQNFLYQPDWQKRVANAIAAPGMRLPRLMEIGGGPGGLTQHLAGRCERLWVVENDRDLAAGLRTRFAAAAGVEIVEQDVLQVDFRAFADTGPMAVAGNLPYYITSPILLHLYRQASLLDSITVMVQKEVAERLVAQPGTRTFGLLTATTALYGAARKLFDLPPGAFRPAPRVHSSLVRIVIAPRMAALKVDEAGFLAFLRRAFAQKRKQLGPRLGIALRARAEDLSLDELAAIYHSFSAHAPHQAKM